MRLTTLTAIIAISATAVLAQDDDDDRNPAVEARHHHMQLFAWNLGLLGGMAKGEVDYNAELATAAAARIHSLAQLDMTGYWPAGTSSEDLDYSRALPVLFENPGEIDEHMSELADAAMEMQGVTGDGPEAIAGQMRALGGACGSCHEEYRKSDD